jgi:hypothetical protein
VKPVLIKVKLPKVGSNAIVHRGRAQLNEVTSLQRKKPGLRIVCILGSYYRDRN